MRTRRILSTLLVLFTLALGAKVSAAGQPRVEWDLSEMYASTEVFLEDRASLKGRIAEIEACRGRLGESAAVMQRCLDLGNDLEKEYVKLVIYAMRDLDKNLRDADAQQLRSETERIGVELSAAVSWMEPEILEIGAEKVEKFLAAQPGLAPHAFYLRDTLRLAPHTLPADQEELLSNVGRISGKFSDAYRQLTISDMPYPTVDLPGIGEVKLDQPSYVKYRGHGDRAVRDAVFTNFWSTFAGYENSLGTLLDSEVQKNWFYSQTREYPSAVERSLGNNNVPFSVYSALIDSVHEHLPVLHRMLELRQRILGIETLKYSDLYASIVPDVEFSYPWEESKPILLEAFAPLGEDYVAQVAVGLESWADVYPADGKRSGAYNSGGWYDGHPWVLLNYNDSYFSLSTTAHEFGHAMHSWLANHNQPYPTSGSTIFAAEVASTFNEALLRHHVLSGEKDPVKRMFLLGTFLEGFRQTVYRQTMFAEFELELHRRAERGETVTGASASKLYLDLLRKYHGHDRGVTDIEELYKIEWAYIPHFYRNFYVYQYATGMVASLALSEKVLAGEPGAVERYIGFLSAGTSDYPVELLKTAGVDLTTREPFELAIRAVNRAMDEIEELLPEVEAEG